MNRSQRRCQLQLQRHQHREPRCHQCGVRAICKVIISCHLLFLSECFAIVLEWAVHVNKPVEGKNNEKKGNNYGKENSTTFKSNKPENEGRNAVCVLVFVNAHAAIHGVPNFESTHACMHVLGPTKKKLRCIYCHIRLGSKYI